MNRRVMVATCGLLALAMSVAEPGTRGVPLSATARMPVKEVTVFKDGHAFVLHEGQMPTDAKGDVVMDYLPTPVMGTFWPYAADPKVKLTAVVAGKRRVLVDRTAMNVRELLEGNVGAQVVIKETSGAKYAAQIVKLLDRGSAEVEATNPPNSTDPLPVKGSLILLKIDEGVKAIPISRIQDVTFKKDPATRTTHEEFRNLLTLRLDWKQAKPTKTVGAGLVYLQRGIRWIPNYRVEIDGKGKATVKLQATLLNEMADLKDVTAHLVIGVPTFAFKDTVDPIALRRTVGQLSQYFQENARTRYALSNAMMTQHARMREIRAPRGPAAGAIDLGPEIGGSKKSEDLFVFTVKHVSLRKGERMVLPVAEYTLKYTDVYTLDVPLAPPPEVRRSFNNQRQQELARLFHAPKAMHKVRLVNKSRFPLTTAPALILQGGRVLGQGMMTYTSVGSSVDLPITTAVDVQVKVTGKEIRRTPNAAKWHGYTYDRIDLGGTITLTNHLDEAIELEVTRTMLGNVQEVDHGGVKEKLDVLDGFFNYPHWWNWYGWPSWWRHFNGIGRVTWKLKLKPGKKIELNYSWHYFWRY